MEQSYEYNPSVLPVFVDTNSIEMSAPASISNVVVYRSKEEAESDFVIERNDPSSLVGTMIDRNSGKEYELHRPRDPKYYEFVDNCVVDSLEKDTCPTRYNHEKVLQYSPVDNKWFSTTNDASFRALLAPYSINAIDFGERRIFLMGEYHGGQQTTCVPRSVKLAGDDSTAFRTMQNIYDPYFVSKFIHQLCYNTNEVIDVFLESSFTTDPATSRKLTSHFIPRLISELLPTTSLKDDIPPTPASIRGGATTSYVVRQPLSNLRVHGSDIRHSVIQAESGRIEESRNFTKIGLFTATYFADVDELNLNYYETERMIDPSVFHFVSLGHVSIDSIVGSLDITEWIARVAPYYYALCESIPEGTTPSDEVLSILSNLRGKLVRLVDRFEKNLQKKYGIRPAFAKSLRRLVETTKSEVVRDRILHYFFMVTGYDIVARKDDYAWISDARATISAVLNLVQYIQRTNPTVNISAIDAFDITRGLSHLISDDAKRQGKGDALLRKIGIQYDSQTLDLYRVGLTASERARRLGFGKSDVVGVHVNLADVYVLARILRNFPDRRSFPERTPFSSIVPRNCLVYFGQAHTQSYTLFLMFYGPLQSDESGAATISFSPSRGRGLELSRKIQTDISLRNGLANRFDFGVRYDRRFELRSSYIATSLLLYKYMLESFDIPLEPSSEASAQRDAILRQIVDTIPGMILAKIEALPDNPSKIRYAEIVSEVIYAIFEFFTNERTIGLPPENSRQITENDINRVVYVLLVDPSSAVASLDANKLSSTDTDAQQLLNSIVEQIYPLVEESDNFETFTIEQKAFCYDALVKSNSLIEMAFPLQDQLIRFERNITLVLGDEWYLNPKHKSLSNFLTDNQFGTYLPQCNRMSNQTLNLNDRLKQPLFIRKPPPDGWAVAVPVNP